MKDKVAVIGAGTAGLIAAKKLAQLGADATVYDQKRTLGHPVRASGILSIRGLAELGIDYGRVVTNTLHGARIHAGGEVMSVESDEEIAHVLDRKRLNDLCHDEAVANGADVVLGRRIDGKMLEQLAEKNIMIGADGAVSQVAKHFSMGEIGRYCLTYKAEFNIASQHPGMVDLFFDNKVSKGLFGWFCPNASDLLEVGIGVDSRQGNARAAFERFLSTDAVSEVLCGARPVSEGASIIPMTLRRRIVDGGRKVLLVGDAAGQVKPSTGGGIIFGGNAAIMAAEGVRKELDGGDGIREYERRYRRKYAFDTALHSIANRLYSGLDQRSLGYLIRIMNALRVDSLLGRYGDMDMPSLMLRKMLYGTALEKGY